MKLGTALNPGGRSEIARAMSLVEVIGVVAVIAVLAAVLFPSAIRILDRLASEREVAVLSSLGNSFRAAILRSRQIPAPANWPSFIATEGGMGLGGVTQNGRRVQRVLLYDKSGWLAANLPYAQTNSNPPGLATPPANARVMIVSSLGSALPSTLNNTDLTAAQFANLWAAPENTLPAEAPWSGWSGRSEDVKVERVNLAPLFVNLVLSTYTGTNVGWYRVDGLTNNYPADLGAGISRYLLKGTPVHLWASAPAPALQHTEVLDHDTSFVYENGLWRNSIVGGVATGLGDISGIVEAFLKAPGNINAQYTNPPKIQQEIIVTNFIAFMSNYNRWEDGNFTDTALQNHLTDTLQPAMIDAVEDLFMYSGGADNHYPTNNYEPCVPVTP